MQRFSVIQGGLVGEPVRRGAEPEVARTGTPRADGCAEAVDDVLRRRLAALRRPLSLVGAEPPADAPRPSRRALGPRARRPVSRDALIGVRPEGRAAEA